MHTDTATSKHTVFRSSRGFGHHFLLPLIAILVVGAIGLYLTLASNAKGPDSPSAKIGFVDDGAYVSKAQHPFSSVRDYLKGGDKNPYAFAITEGGMRHTVLNVGLRELVRVDAATGKTTYAPHALEDRIANAVKWNKSHRYQKLTVHVRLQVGDTAPEEWKDICGRVTMTDPNFNVTAVVPRWWAKSRDGQHYLYRELYANAMKALAPAIDAINADPEHPNIIGSINLPAAAPNYAEPMILYTSSVAVRRSLIRSGFTADEHNKFMLWVPKTAAYFHDIKVELALNPYQNIDENTGDPTNRDKLLYQKMGETLMATVGNRAVLANYSARSLFTYGGKGDYDTMYDWMSAQAKAKKAWAGVQMARPQNVANGNKTPSDPEQWDNVARWAASKGFYFAETTGPGSGDGIKRQPGIANVWPRAYHDDKNDVATMKSIGDQFRRNARS
mgnify:CR=1 FL=1